MSELQAMFNAHPRQAEVELNVLLECIELCRECAETCTSCADACLAEPSVADLVRCIRLNLDCADSCETTARMLTRQTDPDWAVLRAQVEACATVCRSCAQECERHAPHMEHCRICAEVCRRCADACDELLAALAPE
jgi:hypothetical protein